MNEEDPEEKFSIWKLCFLLPGASLRTTSNSLKNGQRKLDASHSPGGENSLITPTVNKLIFCVVVEGRPGLMCAQSLILVLSNLMHFQKILPSSVLLRGEHLRSLEMPSAVCL